MKLILVMFVSGFCFVFNAPAQTEGNSTADLAQRIEEFEQQGKYREAIPLAERLVTLTKQAQGDQNAQTASAITTLANLYERTREYTKAEQLLKEALETYQKLLGPEHPDTATSLN
ncbi:MAG: tetratricopeptide repeat protein, partial [Verrucomicrobia bacterium]|nr:tetratricopeptide repeat protein [Verrucomicrobiota bacterium]